METGTITVDLSIDLLDELKREMPSQTVEQSIVEVLEWYFEERRKKAALPQNPNISSE